MGWLLGQVNKKWSFELLSWVTVWLMTVPSFFESPCHFCSPLRTQLKSTSKAGALLNNLVSWLRIAAESQSVGAQYPRSAQSPRQVLSELSEEVSSPKWECPEKKKHVPKSPTTYLKHGKFSWSCCDLYQGRTDLDPYPIVLKAPNLSSWIDDGKTRMSAIGKCSSKVAGSKQTCGQLGLKITRQTACKSATSIDSPSSLLAIPIFDL